MPASISRRSEAGRSAARTSPSRAGHGDPDGERIFGVYLQGVADLFAGIHGIARYEYYDPGVNPGGIDLFDAGLAWRPLPFLILKADYLSVNRSSQFASPGFQASFALLF